MQTKSYAITPEKAAAAAEQLHAATGVLIDPSRGSGSFSVHNVKLAWTVAAAELTVTIESKPFYVPESAIWGPLDKAFG